jgi:hypothetical protein
MAKLATQAALDNFVVAVVIRQVGQPMRPSFLEFRVKLFTNFKPTE